MDISVVIPALNEADKISGDIRAAAGFFRSAGLQGEVIVVDDGSTDGTSQAARDTKIPEGAEVRIFTLEKNRGKGFAVRTGILASQGDIVLFADSGTCVPFENAIPMIEKLRRDELDLAWASRRHKDTVIKRNRSWTRRLLSRLFHQAAVLLAGLPRWVSDSQCGFKLYRGDVARRLYRACRTHGFMFDLEIILRARAQGLRMAEFPVEWTCDLDTRLRPGTQAPQVLKELIRVRRLANEESGGDSPGPDNSEP
jgi:dolichyl-phosphate beta-glucosyltransferase